ncbi:hypothetical protein AXG93_1543s1120 [Marchantia polymorpha subsp. ruderalis]|uniref:Uncharacterized protein n=1 Tax=Marchantia polymorpha subsp. ruderalis TaxID=1480154 RepID=A0A176VZY3_MARPO|nr:hypothetical protein AXG93_1543s1120 [Marchantia polymorpha subsp. ruderalis]
MEGGVPVRQASDLRLEHWRQFADVGMEGGGRSVEAVKTPYPVSNLHIRGNDDDQRPDSSEAQLTRRAENIGNSKKEGARVEKWLESIAGNARFPQFRKCSFPNSDEFVHGANKNYGPIPDVVKLGLAVVD